MVNLLKDNFLRISSVAIALFYYASASASASDLMDGVTTKMFLGGIEGLIAGVLLVLYIWVWN
jgi:hypothetical protein